VGVFIGCTPFYGFHLLLCIAAAWLFKLNQVKTYLASHVSLPGIWPLLVIAELQLGRFLRGSPPLALRVSEIRHLDVRRFFVDLLLGSTVVGLVLGAAFAWVTHRVVQRTRRQPEVEALLERAARPYVEAGMIQWEFVRGKLRHDPLYFGLLRRGSLPSEGRLLDLGCGRGILFSLLEAARRQAAHGDYPPGWSEPPGQLELFGIEGRAKAARTAATALRAAAEGVGDPERPTDPAAVIHPAPPDDPPHLPLRAEVVHADLRETELPPADVVTLFDVLHYLPAAAQEELLDRIAACLEPGGLLLIREADAAGGGAFWRTRAAERLCAIFRGDLRQRFHYRSRADWQSLLAARGFQVEAAPMSQGTPYANVLIEATKGSSPR
jgi:SAM-dependent methyltransferase